MRSNLTYFKYILPHIPRIISQIDTNPMSATYGCADRAFWHYKTSVIPSARYQEVVLVLTIVYQHKFRNNPYYQSKYIFLLIKAVISYWQKIQLNDGSFNEWYPQEHSFVATAFSLYAVSESQLILNLEIPNLLPQIDRAAHWLSQAKMQPANNQVAGAVIALHNAYLLTLQQDYQLSAEKKLAYLANQQTNEGWLPEYGGADIGYSTVLLDYLAKYHQKTNSLLAIKVAKKLLTFLDFFVHPDLSVGGNYGSRNTAYLIPAGFEYFAQHSKVAQNLLSTIRTKFNSQIMNLDDRYLCYNGYTFLQAGLLAAGHEPQAKSQPKFSQNFSKKFPLAGIFIKSTSKYYLIWQTKKGGVLLIFSKNKPKLIYSFAGMIGQLNRGQTVTTQWLSSSWKSNIGKNKLTVSGNLFKLKPNQPLPLLMLIFNIFQLVVAKFLNYSDLIKLMLRKVMITHSANIPIKYSQKIKFHPNSISVVHTISAKHHTFKKLFIQNFLSLIYVPSSNFFEQHSLAQKPFELDKQQLDKLNQTGKFSYQQQINLD